MTQNYNRKLHWTESKRMIWRCKCQKINHSFAKTAQMTLRQFEIRFCELNWFLLHVLSKPSWSAKRKARTKNIYVERATPKWGVNQNTFHKKKAFWFRFTFHCLPSLPRKHKKNSIGASFTSPWNHFWVILLSILTTTWKFVTVVKANKKWIHTFFAIAIPSIHPPSFVLLSFTLNKQTTLCWMYKSFLIIL